MARSIWKNIITFGAHGRTEDAVEDYNRLCRKIKKAVKLISKRTDQVNTELQKVVDAKMAAIKTLSKAKLIFKNLSVRDRNLTESALEGSFAQGKFDALDNTLSMSQLAMDTAKGMGAGVSVAMGSWALVGTFGTASTGTAIGSLTGVAASNATLAWFGGGSLAAGGAGMAGGALVLGGITVVPALALSALLSHVSANKQIKKIPEAELKLLEAADDCNKMGIILDAAEGRAIEVVTAVNKACEVFEIELARCNKAVFLLGRFSQAIRWLKQKLTGRYFFNSDVAAIAKLIESANIMAMILDIKVLEPDGSVSTGGI